MSLSFGSLFPALILPEIHMNFFFFVALDSLIHHDEVSDIIVMTVTASQGDKAGIDVTKYELCAEGSNENI